MERHKILMDQFLAINIIINNSSNRNLGQMVESTQEDNLPQAIKIKLTRVLTMEVDKEE